MFPLQQSSVTLRTSCSARHLSGRRCASSFPKEAKVKCAFQLSVERGWRPVRPTGDCCPKTCPFYKSFLRDADSRFFRRGQRGTSTPRLARGGTPHTALKKLLTTLASWCTINYNLSKVNSAEVLSGGGDPLAGAKAGPKGCDEDGVERAFQRVGGCCEPMRDFQNGFFKTVSPSLPS